MPSQHQDLPVLHSCLLLKEERELQSLYDARFYPYTPPGVDPVFAVTGHANVTLVCRPVSKPSAYVQVLHSFQDEEADAKYNSLTWSQDLETGDPLICVAGAKPKIKIINVRTGQLYKTLIGHGAPIEDLATHPTSPRFIASVSFDHSVRIWDLSKQNEDYPTVLICMGHRAGLICLAFHPSGRYLLSSGFDHRVNLWVLPELPDVNTGTDKPTVLHYPHFSSTEIHSDYVDCVAFHNTLIISRSAGENRILIWRIHGLAHSTPVPHPSAAPPPTPNSGETRSAFGSGFSILFALDVPDSQDFYLRFELFSRPEHRPILAMGNLKGRVLFWDLQAVEKGDYGPEAHPSDASLKSKESAGRPSVSNPVPKLAVTGAQGKSTARAPQRLRSANASEEGQQSVEPEAGQQGQQGKRRLIDGPFRALKPHRTLMPTGAVEPWAKMTWSVGGEWCVGAGMGGHVAVMRRVTAKERGKEGGGVETTG